jgi:5-methylcytosine-specific restriction endonuclease McrA
MRGTPEEKRKRYRPAYRVTDEEKKRNKRESNRLQHHARRAGGERPSKTALDRQFELQDGRCAYCAVILDAFHIDHKLPIKRGGTNAIENLHFTCPRCNMRKGTMTHEEFLASKKRPVRTWVGEVAA